MILFYILYKGIMMTPKEHLKTFVLYVLIGELLAFIVWAVTQ